MHKRVMNKSVNFFKREGFYVVLFICLCVVATVGVITSKTSNSSDTATVGKENQQNTDVSLSEEGVKQEIPNALEVKNDKQSTSDTAKKNETSSVATTVDTSFQKPVEGTLARGFTTETVYSETIGTYKTNNGIEISAKLGSEVHAVLDGKVETVDNDKTELGKYVIINHQNGLKTVYANLEDSVKLKVGDIVKKGAVIGKVGKTRESYTEEKFGDHLHFEVMKGKEYVDPAKYINYSSKS